MVNHEHGYAFVKDDRSGATIEVQITVTARDEQNIRYEVLDDIADDAVESVLLQALPDED